ncbi:MAG: hypothetical protein ABIX01_12840 [Chitinophagaceae bacterium]
MRRLQIPQRIPLRKENVAFYIHPEGHYKVDNQRAAKSKEGGIDEIEPDFARSDMEFVADVGADAKSTRLNKISKTEHDNLFYTCNL